MVNFNVSVNLVIIEVGVGGYFDVFFGFLKVNVVFNLLNLIFCYFLYVDVIMLSGFIYIYGKIGFLFFFIDFCELVFDWVGVRLLFMVFELFCCFFVYLINS